MNKIIKTALGATLLLALGSTTVNADVAKGQKLFTKKLKKACQQTKKGTTGATIAAKHTQSEWTTIYKEGKMAKEIKTICPHVKDKALKEKYIKHYFDFFKEYGNDSGNVPAC